MSHLTRQLLVLAAIATMIATVPSVAFAGGGGSCSACSIYTEQPPKSTGNSGKTKAKPKKTTTTTVAPTPTVQLPQVAKKTLKHISPKRRAVIGRLARLANERRFSKQELAATRLAGIAFPSAVGAALDLGSGPTALIAALAAGAVFVTGGGALRRRRDR